MMPDCALQHIKLNLPHCKLLKHREQDFYMGCHLVQISSLKHSWNTIIKPDIYLVQAYTIHHIFITPRSFATAEGPCDALCQLKTCQLLQDCMKRPILKGLEKVNDTKGNSR